MNYHIHFFENVYIAVDSILTKHEQVLWLESLQLLWVKHFQQDEEKCKFGILLQDEALQHRVSMIRIIQPEYFSTVKFSSLSIEETRVMMVGLVIDLLRFYTMAASHLKFWQGLVDLITKDYKKAEQNLGNPENSA